VKKKAKKLNTDNRKKVVYKAVMRCRELGYCPRIEMIAGCIIARNYVGLVYTHVKAALSDMIAEGEIVQYVNGGFSVTDLKPDFERRKK
jgi:hypothetical protein